MSNVFRPPCDDAIINCGGDCTPCSGRTAVVVMAVTILGSSMAFIDGTVVNVALPILQMELAASVSHMQWVVEAYALFLAALLLVGGTLGDRLGRRRIFGIGVVIFTAASIWCGLAPDIAQLIAARAIQGVGAALLVPGSLAIISASFSVAQRGRAIGLWAGSTSITASLGPVLGGYLVEHHSWRWIFYLNVPLAAVVMALLPGVPESRDRSAGRLDWPGALLVTAGLAGVVFGCIESTHLPPTDPGVFLPLAAGAALLIAFVVVEARVPGPMMPLGLFASRTFAGTNLLTFFLYAALSGVFFLLPFNLIQVQEYSPTQAGAAFLPLILLISVLSRWAGGLVDRHGPRLPLVVGPVIGAAGYGLLLLPGVGGSYWTTFFPGIIVLGLGMAVSIAPLTTTVMQTVDSRRAGLASGINNAVSRTAGLLAIALAGVLAVGLFSRHLDLRLDGLDLPAGARQAVDAQLVKLAALDIPETITGPARGHLQQAIDAAFVDSFRLLMILAAVLSLLGATIAWLTIGDKGDHVGPGQGRAAGAARAT